MTRNKDENLAGVIGPKQTISVKAVLLYMLFLFAIFVTFMIWFRYSNFSPLADYYQKGIAITKVNLRSLFSDKVSTNAIPGSKVEIKVTEQQLSDSASVTKPSFPLKKASLKIFPTGVQISGKMSDAIWDFMTVEVTLLPVVKDGVVTFEIKEIKAAGVQAPPKVTDLIAPEITNIFSYALPKNKELKITDVYLMQGFLRIEGEKVAAAAPVN